MRPAQIGSRNPMRKAQFSAQWWLRLHGSHYPWLSFLLWAGNVHKQLLIKCWQYMTCTVTQVFFVMNGFKLKLTTSEFVLLVMAQKFNWRTGSKTILHVYNEFPSSGLTHVSSQNISNFQNFNASTIQYTSIYCIYLSRTSTATYCHMCVSSNNVCCIHLPNSPIECHGLGINTQGYRLVCVETAWESIFKSPFVGGAILVVMLHINITWYLHVFTHLVNVSLL